MTWTLTNFGEFPDYEHKPRIAIADDLLITRTDMALKLYRMVREGGEVSESMSDIVRRFLHRARIKPFSGLGFVILSDGMLNVARWDSSNPCVLKNDLWEYTPVGECFERRKLSVSKEGAFCAWELGIVAHEKDAWLRYLASKRCERDKIHYLSDRFSGSLLPGVRE